MRFEKQEHQNFQSVAGSELFPPQLNKLPIEQKEKALYQIFLQKARTTP